MTGVKAILGSHGDFLLDVIRSERIAKGITFSWGNPKLSNAVAEQ